MKKIITNYRYYILFITMMVAIIGILCMPNEDLAQSKYICVLVLSKIIGLIAALITAKLITRYNKLGVISELINHIKID